MVSSAGAEREHLAQVDRHIAERRAHITRQRESIQDLLQNGHDIESALSMLHLLQGALRSFELHRVLVIKRLTDAG